MSALNTREVAIRGGEIKFHVTTSGAKDAQPVLWLHGSGPGVTALTNWEAILEDAQGDYYNIAPDIVGFGDSTHPNPPPVGMPAFTALRVETLKELLDEMGIDKVDLVGNSMGGVISMCFVLAYPERVRRIVLMGAAGKPIQPPPALLSLVLFYENPTVAAMAELMTKFVVDPQFFGERLEAIAAERMPRATRPEVERSHRATFTPTEDPMPIHPDSLATVQQPVLVIQGDSDQLIPEEVGRWYHEHLANSRLEVVRERRTLVADRAPRCVSCARSRVSCVSARAGLTRRSLLKASLAASATNPLGAVAASSPAAAGGHAMPAGKIDVHQHMLPRVYVEGLASIGIDSAGGVAFPQWSPGAAIEMMDAQGIATGILSISSPGVHFGNDAVAIGLARRCNEHAAEIVADRPERLGAFAMVAPACGRGRGAGGGACAGHIGAGRDRPALEPLRWFLPRGSAIRRGHGRPGRSQRSCVRASHRAGQRTGFRGAHPAGIRDRVRVRYEPRDREPHLERRRGAVSEHPVHLFSRGWHRPLSRGPVRVARRIAAGTGTGPQRVPALPAQLLLRHRAFRHVRRACGADRPGRCRSHSVRQ